MTYYYPAVIRKKEDGYRVDVIDLEDCYGEGKTKEEALEDARYAGVNWLLVESEESMDFPRQTHLDDIVLGEDRELGISPCKTFGILLYSVGRRDRNKGG